MICYVLAMGKQHLGPHVVVGYGIKIFWPGLFITSPDHLGRIVKIVYLLAAAGKVRVVYLLAAARKVKIVYLLAAARKVRIVHLAAGRKVGIVCLLAAVRKVR